MAECYLCCQDSQNKMDKTKPAAANNVALLDSNGNVIDSGKQLTPEGIGADQAGTGLYSSFTNIPENADLNDYTACGHYACEPSSTAQTITNIPFKDAFCLIVYNSTGNTDDTGVISGKAWRYRLQRFISYTGIEYVRSVRTNGSGEITYDNWFKLLSENDWPALKSEITLSSLGAESLISRGAYFGDLNAVGNSSGTLYDNSVVWFSTRNGTTNAPVDGYGYCMTWSNGGGYIQQLVYLDGSQYTRMYYDGGSGNQWHDWIPSNNYVINSKDTSDKIYIAYKNSGLASVELKALAGFDNDGNIANADNMSVAGIVCQYLGFASNGGGVGTQGDPANVAYNLSSIRFGTWTPVISGASSHLKQSGWYLTIGGTCIIGWYAYGRFAGSTTTRFSIQGCPFTPLEISGGGGGCSGYTSANNIIFTGYEIRENANIYAVGQETSTSSTHRWQSINIYQKASGDTSSYGTIAFKITPVSD